MPALLILRSAGVVLAFLVNRRALHIARQKIQGIGLIAFDGVAIAREVMLGPTGELILVFCLLRLVLKIPLVDGFGVACLIDPDYQLPAPARSCKPALPWRESPWRAPEW